MNCRSVFRRAILALGLGLAALPAAASDRHFVFSQESPVLNDGSRELETYATYSFGRDHFFSRVQGNLEYEQGLGGGFQTSLYVNFDQVVEDDGLGGTAESFIFDGIATELKLKLLDNVADPVGLGLYLETEFEPDELDVETKVIVDKRMGDLLWTFNLTTEPHFGWPDDSYSLTFSPSMGLGAFVVPNRFLVGLEAVNENLSAGQPLAVVESVLSVGPVLSYTGSNWWTTLTLLPQVANFMGSGLDLTNSQKWQVRLGLSWEI
jgi:hypothetical protein